MPAMGSPDEIGAPYARARCLLYFGADIASLGCSGSGTGFVDTLGFSGATVDAFGDGADTTVGMIDGVDAGFDAIAVDAVCAEVTGVGTTGSRAAGFSAADFEVTGADATGSVERGDTFAAG